MPCPSNTPLGIGGIKNIMSDYLVDDIFICVFHCDVQRHYIRGVVMKGFGMSDVGNVLVLSDEVADSVNIFYISPLDVGRWALCVGFIGSTPPGTILVEGYSRFSRWVLS